MDELHAEARFSAIETVLRLLITAVSRIEPAREAVLVGSVETTIADLAQSGDAKATSHGQALETLAIGLGLADRSKRRFPEW